MLRRSVTVGVALLACLVGAGTVATPAHAWLPDCPIDTCDGGGDSGGGGGGGPAYNLQGVIQLEAEAHEGNWPYVQGRIKIRGYSRLATWDNDRVDANHISVACVARVLTYSEDESDSEDNGALVDVHFWSSTVPVSGVPASSRTVTVNCTHHATKNGVDYDTTSTAQFVIPA